MKDIYLFVNRLVIIGFTVFFINPTVSLLAQRLESSDVGMGLRSEILIEESGNRAVELNWTLPENTSRLTLQKRELGRAFSEIPLPSISATSYVDPDIIPGVYYEYAISAETRREFSGSNGASVPFVFYGYCQTGVGLMRETSAGRTVLLVIDSILKPQIENALIEYKLSLLQDGWGYREILAPRTETFNSENVEITHSKIVASVKAEPSIRSVFLIGRIAVPYSGEIVPDGHTNDHTGAWPFDAYYATTIARNLPDNTVNNESASRQQNKNIPGDGKYDFSSGVPINLAIGRVDFYDLPEFTSPESDLISAYLLKAAEWHRGKTLFIEEAIVDDNFPAFNYVESFAASGYRAGRTIVGIENTKDAEWKDAMMTDNYLFAYGCGAGSYSSCAGTINTKQLAEGSRDGVFGFLFGSYFGDWDSRNNLMRSALASGNLLTCAWAARPHWFIHSMNVGATIGQGFITSYSNTNAYFSHLIQNNGNWGYINTAANNIHIALMGDPTLSLYPAKTTEEDELADYSPIQNTNTAVLEWENPEGSSYLVYRSLGPTGPFVRASPEIITSNRFEEQFNYEGTVFYQLRKIDTVYNYGTELLSEQLAGMAEIALKDWTTVEEFIDPELQSNIIDKTLVLRASESLPVQLDIVDIMGKTITSKELLVTKGENLFDLDRIISVPISDGLYIANLRWHASALTKKFIFRR